MNNEPDYKDNLVIGPQKTVDLQAENDKLKDVLRLCRGRFSHYTAYDDEMMVKIIDKVL